MRDRELDVGVPELRERVADREVREAGVLVDNDGEGVLASRMSVNLAQAALLLDVLRNTFPSEGAWILNRFEGSWM